MVNEYLETALWSTTGFNDENLDDDYTISDISDAFHEQAEKECDEFMNLARHLFTEDELENGNIGHDFWLTRNGHGAGFWDGDYEKGDEITAIVNAHFPQNDDDLRENVEKAA